MVSIGEFDRHCFTCCAASWMPGSSPGMTPCVMRRSGFQELS